MQGRGDFSSLQSVIDAISTVTSDAAATRGADAERRPGRRGASLRRDSGCVRSAPFALPVRCRSRSRGRRPNKGAPWYFVSVSRIHDRAAAEGAKGASHGQSESPVLASHWHSKGSVHASHGREVRSAKGTLWRCVSMQLWPHALPNAPLSRRASFCPRLSVITPPRPTFRRLLPLRLPPARVHQASTPPGHALLFAFELVLVFFVAIFGRLQCAKNPACGGGAVGSPGHGGPPRLGGHETSRGRRWRAV